MTASQLEVSVFSTILEIVRTGYDREDILRRLQATDTLRQRKLAGYPIRYVLWSNQGDSVIVPDFGHNAHCACPRPEPQGVQRYFGLYLVVLVSPRRAAECFGTYEINTIARLFVAGFDLPPTTGDFAELRLLDKEVPWVPS